MVSPFLRKVTTASGATAVQVVAKHGRRNKVLEHLGSAHSGAELAALMEAGRSKIHAGQGEIALDMPVESDPAAVVHSSASRLLIETITKAWEALGFEGLDDKAFFQLVAAGLIEPTSMLDSSRVLDDIGIQPVHRSTMKRCLARIQQRDYRGQVATKCFNHAWTSGDVSLVLYDVTTLYFEAEKEDELRKVGFSKERRVDPQIVVGLLVDRNGFPLEIGCYEGNKAETLTIVPIVKQFQARHGLADMVVVADAGMLSMNNLADLDEAELKVIVGSRPVKAPGDLANHFHWNGDAFQDGQLIDTVTPKHGNTKAVSKRRRAEPVWDPQTHPGHWRAVWAYSRKRAVHDNYTITQQENKARAVVAHELWYVERSFRMSKTDLQARSMFHRQRDAIEAHLTIVFTALAITRYLQDNTGFSIRKIIRTLRPLQDVTISVAGQRITAKPQLTDDARAITDALGIGQSLGH